MERPPVESSRDPIKFSIYTGLVGGFLATPLKNMSSSIGMMRHSQLIWENRKFMATIHHQAEDLKMSISAEI